MLNRFDTTQMELGLDKQITDKTGGCGRRESRARWWFGQMRRVVDVAREWKPGSSGRPEQVRFSLPTRRW